MKQFMISDMKSDYTCSVSGQLGSFLSAKRHNNVYASINSMGMCSHPSGQEGDGFWCEMCKSTPEQKLVKILKLVGECWHNRVLWPETLLRQEEATSHSL
ncbi:hypothetical protein AMECASPLE_008442 [Ameca splendens]|uniref:Uncharacterized protein n=1 Tax=Ameca splendens TaxID=208324 RepID=A0ABV1A8V8_9TELE